MTRLTSRLAPRAAAAFALAALALSQPAFAAGEAKAPVASIGDSKSVKPAAERTLAEGPRKPKPGAKTDGAGATTMRGPGSRPATRGPKLPEALLAQLQVRLDARVNRDVDKIRALRTEAVGLLRGFVAETPKESREMPEAMMRLGELLWEDEREGFVNRFAEWEKKPVDVRGPAPDPNYKPSRDLFARVIKDYPNFSQYDLTLYVDGFLASEQGQQDDALERFSRILKEFPNSRFVADAHMAKAESYFGAKYDYQAALGEYEEVLKFQGTDLYGLALFKSAWCLWRLGRSDEATLRFVKVFDVTDSRAKTANGSQRRELGELQAEALKYLVEVFSEDEKNTAADMYAFLVKIGGDRFAGKIVRALAETFYDQAHYERGVEAYELLLKLDPTSPDAGNLVLLIAQGYDTIEDYPKLKATYARALAEYTDGSPWARSQADKETVPATARKLEVQLRQSATTLHAKAQKDKTSRAEYQAAADMYGVYLGRFSKEPKGYETQFYLADIEFYHLDKANSAADHYMDAAKAIPESASSIEPGKSLRHDAIYNALAALERTRLTEIDARKKNPGQPFAETETDKKFSEALDLYAQIYPDDPALAELFFRQGKLYYDNQLFDPAVRIFGSLLERFPKAHEAQPAGELILDSFNKSKNYENIEVWAKRLKTAPSFQSPDQQKRLDTLAVQAVFKQGEAKSAALDHAGAAKAYMRAAREYPKDPRAAQACVNAELSAQKAFDTDTLREAALLITGKDYRDRSEAPQGAWIAATTFQSMGLFADSAEYHESIAALADREHPNFFKFEHARDAAYNAVLLRTTVGEYDRAISDGNRFLTLYGTTPEADEVYFTMGRAHLAAGHAKEAIDLYRRYISRTKNDGKRTQAYLQIALAGKTMNDDKTIDDALKAAVSIGKLRGSGLGAEGKFAAAHARYMEGERVLAKFDQIQIQGDVKQLSARLKQKAELLKAAASLFLDTVSMGVAEWTTAALFQVGRTYESFAKALKEAPPPANLSDADKEAYQQQIDEFVVPIEEKSLDAYENGWKKAVELGIFNQWTAKMREALGRLNAELYPPFREVGFEIRSQGPSPFPALLAVPARDEAPKVKADAKDPASKDPASKDPGLKTKASP